ncbi:ankyrin repeat domain-containing protein [Paenibacillus sp. M1]|uniref:Ankyrin repeat domain-containing protein n=1 Tax=Paenibacillus haidiansis TaxID=1574488 RepID=A0ABU7VSQ8_9BACL
MLRSLFIPLIIALALLLSSCSILQDGQASGGIQNEDLAAISSGITAYGWEEQVGYDRLRALVGGILEDWRGQGIQVEQFFDDPDVENEFWTQMVLIYFTDEQGQNATLLDAMNWLRDNQSLLKEQSLAAVSEISGSPEASGAGNTGNTGNTGTAGESATESILNTRLVEAVNLGDVAAAEQLLSQGADPNAADEYGSTLLALAVFHGYSASDMPDADFTKKRRDKGLKLVKLLLAEGADPSKDPQILVSAGMDLPEACMPLLEAGADVNAQDETGNTALFYLLQEEQIFAELLGRGADPEIANDEGKTVYDVVRENNATGIAKLLGMELAEQTVTPVNPYVEQVFNKLHNGISQSEALKTFGPNPAKGTDDMDGSEIWGYTDKGKGFEPISGDFGTVDVEGIKSGSVKTQLYIYWNEIQTMWYSTVYALGPDNEVYIYYVNPGDEKTIGQPH